MLLPNVEVWAWSEKGGWGSDVTNVNGAYSLVGIAWPAGKLVSSCCLPKMAAPHPYLPAPPSKKVRVAER